MFDSMSGPNATEAGTALQNIATAINKIASAFDKLGNAYGKVKPILDKFPASIIRTKFWDFIFSSGGQNTGVPNRATGGGVIANQPYMVGEFGPELFVPSGSGSIRPNGGGSGTTIINLNGIVDAESARRSIERLLQSSSRRTGAVNFNGATL
jgi:hypothetical protein